MKNEATDKATARPWQQYHAGIYQPYSGHAPGTSAHVCDVISDSKSAPSDQDLANAALIVQSVNEHAALVAVAEAAKQCELAIVQARIEAGKIDDRNGDVRVGVGRELFPCNQAVVQATDSALYSIRAAFETLAAIQKGGGGE